VEVRERGRLATGLGSGRGLMRRRELGRRRRLGRGERKVELYGKREV
jgi:hypothetical protein